MTVKIPVRLGRSKPVIQVKESDIQKACMQLLQIHGWWVERRNTGAFSGEYKGRKRFVRYSRKGTADLMAYSNGFVVWIEVKRDDGHQSLEQALFQREVEQYGMSYWIIRSIDELNKKLGVLGSDKKLT